MMQVFKTDASRFKEVKRLILLKGTPLLFIAVIIGFAIAFFNSSGKGIDLYLWPFLLLIVLIPLAIGRNKTINMQKVIFDSYTITITNNLISREQSNMPIMSIYLDDIVEIIKYKNGSIIIKGENATEIIGIPAQMENYPLLLSTLENIQPIITTTPTFLHQHKNTIIAITMGMLMLCVYTVNNKLVVATAGGILTVLIVWSYIKIHNNKNIDQNTKKITRWLIVVLASVVLVTIVKVIGLVNPT